MMVDVELTEPLYAFLDDIAVLADELDAWLRERETDFAVTVRKLPLRARLRDWLAHRRRTASIVVVDGVRVRVPSSCQIVAAGGKCNVLEVAGGDVTIPGSVLARSLTVRGLTPGATLRGGLTIGRDVRFAARPTETEVLHG